MTGAPQRLTNATLDRLPADVVRPAYDRRQLGTGIVHLGPGAFHRGQEAVFTDAAITAAGDLRWGILGVGLRSPDIRDALRPQDFLYSVAARDDAAEEIRVIGALTGILVAPENPLAVIAAMADPQVAIVSLTVTEKGYGLDPASGDLDCSHPDIRHDLDHPESPRSALGLVVAALARRRAATLPPFAVLCCDNLSENGATVARLAHQFAAELDPDLAAHIAGDVAFPSTMLDRIVPATTDADRAQVALRLGLIDHAPVIAEAHNQWVVEDHFPLGRPDWAAAGVKLVGDVAPYEAIKLKLLNASHSALAYLGSLAGHETIADATADPVFRRFIEDMMEVEVLPTLRVPTAVDAAGYARSVVTRFANRAIRHRTAQIAMDGSQKLPPRLLGTIRNRLAEGAAFDHLALAVAGWMRFVTGLDEQGRSIDLRDPLAVRIADVTRGAGRDAGRLVAGLTGIAEIFGTDLPGNARFTDAVHKAIDRIFAVGARQAVAEAAHGRPATAGR